MKKGLLFLAVISCSILLGTSQQLYCYNSTGPFTPPGPRPYPPRPWPPKILWQYSPVIIQQPVVVNINQPKYWIIYPDNRKEAIY